MPYFILENIPESLWPIIYDQQSVFRGSFVIESKEFIYVKVVGPKTNDAEWNIGYLMLNTQTHSILISHRRYEWKSSKNKSKSNSKNKMHRSRCENIHIVYKCARGGESGREQTMWKRYIEKVIQVEAIWTIANILYLSLNLLTLIFEHRSECLPKRYDFIFIVSSYFRYSRHDWVVVGGPTLIYR